MLFLAGLGIWILGMVIFYILDGWFNYDFKDPNGDPSAGQWVVSSLTWPVWLFPILIRLVAIKAHDALAKKKLKRTQKKEEELKFRIAQEKEVQKEIEKIDEELEFSVKRKHKTR